MQNTTSSSRKWTELQGLAAVAIDTGAKVGTLDDFYFDTQSTVVKAFTIKTGVFSHRVLLSSTITSIGVDALTFPKEDVLIKEESESGLVSLVQAKNVLAYRVLSESGTVLGTIGNFILDTSVVTGPRIVAFELAAGLRARISGHYPSFDASQVTRYGLDVMVVPDAVAQSLSQE